MSKNYIGKVLSYEMQRGGLTQSALADHALLPQSTISQIIGGEVRIAPASLHALTHCWPSAEVNGRVLIAHLRDEIKRAGHNPVNAVDIRWPAGKRATTISERSMEVLRRHIEDPDVAAFTHSLAALLRRSEKRVKIAQEEHPGIAADPHGQDYRTK